MASPKKKKKKLFTFRPALVFLSGVALPLCLAAGWHAAYGQQDGPPVSAGREASPASQTGVVSPAISPRDELATMRPLFTEFVRKPTLERIEHYKKVWSKAQKLQQILEERRQRLLALDQAYFDFVRQDVRVQMAKAGVSFGDSQYFVYADRNPAAQFVLVGFYDASRDTIDFLGADLISSGNIGKGGDYFETPTGVFENLVENFSYRALGTPNQEGWRGLGSKDSRVWDFGDQRGLKKYKDGNTVSQMRLLMHSTDPDNGEPRLGRTDSKGCVRISQGLNRFLDTYAILDRNYEEWARTRADTWLLKKDRTPVAYPGKFLIIGDSSEVLQGPALLQTQAQSQPQSKPEAKPQAQTKTEAKPQSQAQPQNQIQAKPPAQAKPETKPQSPPKDQTQGKPPVQAMPQAPAQTQAQTQVITRALTQARP